jgi:hypothetical protein
MENFDLRISDYDGYSLRVAVTHSAAGEVAPVMADAPDVSILDLLEASGASLRATAADFTAQVMPDPVWRAWRESWAASGERGLRLRIRCESANSLHIPWELLYDGERNYFLAQDPRSPVVRYLEGPIVDSAKPIEAPLRLLLTGASPEDWPPLTTESELNGIVSVLSGAKPVGKVEVTRLDNLTPDQLDRALLEVKPHLFHFAGHGEWDERGEVGQLVLDNGQGRSFKLADSFLSMLLRNRGVALVVLNACKSALGGSGWSGLAHSLVVAGVPAVVAMTAPVSDGAAAAFAGTLYAALANRYSLEQAVTLARQTTARQPDEMAAPGEWLAPALFMRTGSERFWLHEESEKVSSGAEGVPATRIDIGAIHAVNLAMGNQTIIQPDAKIHVGDRKIDTGGGDYIEGNVTVSGGDFVGRDKVINMSGGGKAAFEKAFIQLAAAIAGHASTADVQRAMQLVTAMQKALVQGNDEQVADTIGDLGDLVPGGREKMKTMLSRPPIHERLGPAAKYALRRLG